MSIQTQKIGDMSIAGHVPRYTWYALRYGTVMTVEVKDKRPKRSFLVQDGLEILIEMSVVWNNAVKIKK